MTNRALVINMIGGGLCFCPTTELFPASLPWLHSKNSPTKEPTPVRNPTSTLQRTSHFRPPLFRPVVPRPALIFFTNPGSLVTKFDIFFYFFLPFFTPFASFETSLFDVRIFTTRQQQPLTTPHHAWKHTKLMGGCGRGR